MPTNTAAHVARAHPLQVVNYLRKTVNYNDPNIATGVPFGAYLPAGASILMAKVFIKTAFNAVTTNVLTVGQNGSSYNDIVNASDVDETTASRSTIVFRGADLDLSGGDALPYVKYTQTGTAATAGVAEIPLLYTNTTDP